MAVVSYFTTMYKHVRICNVLKLAIYPAVSEVLRKESRRSFSKCNLIDLLSSYVKLNFFFKCPVLYRFSYVRAQEQYCSGNRNKRSNQTDGAVYGSWLVILKNLAYNKEIERIHWNILVHYSVTDTDPSGNTNNQ